MRCVCAGAQCSAKCRLRYLRGKDWLDRGTAEEGSTVSLKACAQPPGVQLVVRQNNTLGASTARPGSLAHTFTSHLSDCLSLSLSEPLASCDFELTATGVRAALRLCSSAHFSCARSTHLHSAVCTLENAHRVL